MHSFPFSSGGPLLGILGVIVSVLLVILAIMWFIFPFIVSHKLQLLINESKKQTELLEQLQRDDAPPLPPSSLPLPGAIFEPPSRHGWFAAILVILILALIIMVVIRLG